ncbi:MAG: hypothetical protein WDN26_17470 [Chitinophagaceae bacterium]
MSIYRWSTCLPDKAGINEMGLITKEDAIEAFEQFPWIEHLSKMDFLKEEDIYYSPSLEFENTDTKHMVTFSIVGDDKGNEFYIFYKRPKVIRSFFGLSKKEVEDYVSDITGQTKEDAIKFLTAFLNNDTAYMESKIKEG